MYINMLVHQFIATLAIIISFITPIEDFQVEMPSKQIRVMAVGDIMMHHPITVSGLQRDSSGYDFRNIFKQVKPIFAQADLVLANLETPLADQKGGFSGYPLFKAPKELALAIKDSGIDVVTTANNHALDQGEKGLKQTLDILDSYGVSHTGTYRTQAEKDELLVLNIKGIKIGLLSYTYGINGLYIPDDKQFLVSRLDNKQIEHDIENLNQADVDYIIALVHFGIEYQRFPNDTQKQWINDMYASGIDFIIGSHPHVVQPFELNNVDNQSDKGVIYSLGNFLSNQTGNWKDYGTILDLTLEKQIWDKKIRLTKVEFIPTYVKRGWEKGTRSYEVIPLIPDLEKDIDKDIWSNGQNLLKHIKNNLHK